MKYLGDHSITLFTFQEQEVAIEEMKSEEFNHLSDREKSERVSRTLLHLIETSSQESFLLIPLLAFIDKVAKEKLIEGYTFATFELWLNQYSDLTEEENYEVRGKIAGKFVPRDEYQVSFPVGTGKRYAGSHTVTAHSSPDLDTTIASFWGWVDAFAARVSEGLHHWNVPGGPPSSQVEIDLLFHKIFGQNAFSYLAKTRSSLGLSSIDLMNQRGVVKRRPEESTLLIDHERAQNAVIIVDDSGYYLGDWRTMDVEGVRQVIMLLNNCMRWFENNLHAKLISLFGKDSLSKKEVSLFFERIFGTTFRECQPVREYSEKQKENLHDYLEKVLEVPGGLEASFDAFSLAMKRKGLAEFQEFIDLVATMQDSPLFTSSGILTENRPRIFHYLEKVILALDKAIFSVRIYEERLEVSLSIKTDVLGYLPQVVSYRAEIEEIRSKIGNYLYLTVTSTDREGKLVPMGVIHSADLYKTPLGTVSVRDFCNREETRIPSYLEVISAIDHHKTNLTTLAPPVVQISDAQSSNALVAELSFIINDSYSTGGMTLKEINTQLEEVKANLSSAESKRIFQRLLKKHAAAEHRDRFFVAPEREYVEYLHFLYAILDDTDLLTKVTKRDLECVASLLNRLKSLMLRKEVEVVSFDGLPRDKEFLSAAAGRILQNKEMYSLYQKIYLRKEESVEQNLQHCVEGLPSSIFVDTKDQNGCCRVGQTKMFARNYPMFEKLVKRVRMIWAEEARLAHKESSEIDFYLHMISTIAGAEDVFAGTAGEYSHLDELWIWIPGTESSVEHLKSFLNAFKNNPRIASNVVEVEFMGSNAKELQQIFRESFLPVEMKSYPEEEIPIAVIRYKAGALNSRKAMISPYLPKLIT